MDDINEEVILILATSILQIGLIIYLRNKEKEKHKRWKYRRWWVHPINLQRDKLGDFCTLFQELKNDPERFFRYLRMSKEMFNELLEKVSIHLIKTSHRKPLLPEQRLAITLRYLATGDLTFSIALQYRVGESTVRELVNETCSVLVKVLSPMYLKPPSKVKWLEIINGFYETWNMPNCIGAVDGKHIQIQAPPNSGPICFNYKKTFSTILMAACDHEYKFTIVDIGAYGSESDGGIFERSSLGKAINNDLNLPANSATLPGSNQTTPYFFVGDAAFKMSRHMMRPYPGRNLTVEKKVFNYRLSRARRVIENAFGILVARWRIFTKPIKMNLEKVETIIAACVCLHNFIMTEEKLLPISEQQYAPHQYIDTEDDQGNVILGQWRHSNDNRMTPLANTSAHRATNEAYHQRDILNKWMMSPEGQVPWQLDYVFRGQHRDDHSITVPFS